MNQEETYNTYLAYAMSQWNKISDDVYTPLNEISQENIASMSASINDCLQTEVVILAMINRAKLTADVVKKFLIKNSITDITLQQFLNTQVEAFCSDLFKDYTVKMTGSLDVSEADIKELAVYECINKFKTVGKYATIFTHKSETITVREFIDDVMVNKFIRFIADCQGHFGFEDVIGNLLQKYTDRADGAV